MKKNHRFIEYVEIVIIICTLLLGLDLILSQKYISVTKYIYENTEIKQSFKIVQLTDLYNYQYGVENYWLINKVKNETPDVIFLTGDMLNRDDYPVLFKQDDIVIATAGCVLGIIEVKSKATRFIGEKAIKKSTD